MKLTLIDWADLKRKFDIGDLDDIMTIDIWVVTGDEIAYITYKDGREKIFDSNFLRIADFFDYRYTIYDREKGTNLIFAEKFLKRETSYDMEKIVNEEIIK